MADHFDPEEWQRINERLDEAPDRYGFLERRDGSVLLGSFNIRKSLVTPTSAPTASGGSWRGYAPGSICWACRRSCRTSAACGVSVISSRPMSMALAKGSLRSCPTRLLVPCRPTAGSGHLAVWLAPDVVERVVASRWEALPSFGA